MKNILYICPFAHIGGGEVSLLTLLKYLDREKFKPFLICYSEGPLIQRAGELGLEVTVMKYDSFISSFFVIREIMRFIKNNNIDLVHVNSLDIRGALASFFCGVPYIGHLRVIFPFTWRDCLFAGLSKKVISVSGAVVDVFCKKCSEREKFTIIPNAVDHKGDVIKALLREEFGLPENSLLVGAMGRIDPVKGYEYFLEAAALIKKELPRAYFFIAGDIAEDNPVEKRYLETLKKRIEYLKIKDCFYLLGFRKDALNVIAALDILVVPSVVIKGAGGITAEGFGRVAAEAMACGVPVVASGIGGLREIVEDGKSGILVSEKDPAGIFRAVVNLLSDRSKYEAIVNAARERFDSLYSVTRHLELVQGVYRELTNAPLESQPCEICGGTFFEISERSGGGYNVLKCVKCGFNFVYPKPEESILSKSYGQDYYKPWLLEQRKKRIKMWGKRLSILNRLSGRKGRLLDLGCGEGLFLELAKADGWDIAATEFSHVAAEHARQKLGIQVFEGEIEKMDFLKKEFDAVTAWHVLEHTISPINTLKKIKEIIKEDGVLVLALPNLENKITRILYRIIKGRRQHLFAPSDRELHLNFFTKETISLILKKAGFDVVVIFADRACVTWKERLFNAINGIFYALTGRMYFDSIEVHAKPRVK